MGQCSTLPAEARGDHNNESPSYYSEQNRYRSKDMTMEPSSDNSTTPLTQRRARRPSGYHLQVQTGPHNGHPQSPHDPAMHNPHSHLPPSGPPRQTQQQHHGTPFGMPPMSPPPQSRQASVTPVPQPMQEERGGYVAPPPPDCAVRQRCYKLNLDSEHVGILPAARHDGHIYGPFADVAPPLTYSGSEDSVSEEADPTTVAIRTAQIFRGITVSKDGTILSQNARATKSSRNSKTKRGEKSRQAAKIDKAKDLVEEAVLTGKAADDSDSQMVSLVIVGEYDEMKQLVRDGAKKLRDANGLPDDALLAVNRPRGSSPIRNPVLSPSRKRVSPFAVGSPHSAGYPKSPSNKSRHLTNNNAPPKLKGHPRDPSRRIDDGRQNSRRGFSPLNDPCNDMFNQNADSDWGSSLGLSRGLNSIWYCGANGGSGSTMSPTQSVKEHKAGYPVSPQSRKPIMEGRNESSYRGGMRGVSERMEPPGHHHPVHA